MSSYELELHTLKECDVTAEMFHAFAGLALPLKTKTGGTYSRATLGEYCRKAKEAIEKRFPKHKYWNSVMEEGEGEGMTGENFCLSLGNSLGKEIDRTKLNDAAEGISPPKF